MKFDLLGISFTIGGEAETNAKLDRYHELAKDEETETDEELLASPDERLELYMELRQAGAIILDADEPKGFWGKIFG